MKYIVAFLMALMSLGCMGGSPKAEVMSYPSWYLNPPANNASFLYGVGEGSDINSAKASALGFVADSLSLTVSSELQKSDTSNRVNGREDAYSSVVSSVKTQAKEMEFSEYKIVNNQQMGSKIVLLVEVSREKLFQDQKLKAERFSKELEAEKKSIAQHSTLKQALLYKKRASKSAKLKSLALLTQTINSGFNVDAYMNQAREVENASLSALNKVKMSVKASKEAQVYVNAIKEGLNNAGIKTGSSGATTQLYLDNSFQTDEIYGFKIAKSTLNIAVKEKGKTVSSKSHVLSGRSKYDFEKAKQSAAQLLSKKIETEGIFSVIGIE